MFEFFPPERAPQRPVSAHMGPCNETGSFKKIKLLQTDDADDMDIICHMRMFWGDNVITLMNPPEEKGG